MQKLRFTLSANSYSVNVPAMVDYISTVSLKMELRKREYHRLP